MQSLKTKLRKRKYKLGLGREHESPGTNAGSEWQFETFSPHIFSSPASAASSANSARKWREKEADPESPPPVPPPRFGIAVEPKRPSSWSPTLVPPVPPHAWQLASGDSSGDASALASSPSSKKLHVSGSNPNLTKPTRHRHVDSGSASGAGASNLSGSNPDLKRSASCYQDPRDARLEPRQSSDLMRSNRNLYGFLDFNWSRSNPRSSSRSNPRSNPRSIPRSNPRIIPGESIQQVPKVEPVYANPYRKKKAAAAAAAKQLLLDSQLESDHIPDGASNHVPDVATNHIPEPAISANEMIEHFQRSTNQAKVAENNLTDLNFSAPSERRAENRAVGEEHIDREGVPPPVPPHGPGVTCTRIFLPPPPSFHSPPPPPSPPSSPPPSSPPPSSPPPSSPPPSPPLSPTPPQSPVLGNDKTL